MLTGAASHRPFVSPGARSALPAGSMHGNATAEQPRWNGSNLAGCQLTWASQRAASSTALDCLANTLVSTPSQTAQAWPGLCTNTLPGLHARTAQAQAWTMLRYAALDCTRTIRRGRRILDAFTQPYHAGRQALTLDRQRATRRYRRDELRPVSRLSYCLWRARIRLSQG
jgi:hypothetical protein